MKNESEKKRKRKIYSSNISPIIIQESNGIENQNSILSHEIITPNSFDRDLYERSNYNYNYPTNYGRINLTNYNNNEPDYEERYYYPSVTLNPNNNINEDYIQEDEYFINHASPNNNKKDILSPIGYIATYSSGNNFINSSKVFVI